MATFTLNIAPTATIAGCPNIECECGRITVLLGANGTGKSQTLRLLKDSAATFGAGRKRVYVEGGRVVAPLSGKLNLHLIQQQEVQHQAPGQQKQPTLDEQYDKSLTERLQQRLNFVFHKLALQADPHKRKCFDMFRAWQHRGRQGAPPPFDDTLLDKVFDRFQRVFPDITLSSNPKTFEVFCQKDGKSYPVADLSDGEKQVLAMLADLTSCAPPNAVFLVDEPELNLHPLLACRLWNVIESELPDAIFIYGTHCISFAMRACVETRILLGRRGEPAQPLPDIAGLDSQRAEEFLGAIPAVVVARNVVAVEGKEDSFDTRFYQWLLGDEYKVVPVGSCESVGAAARGAGLWSKIATTVRIRGVIDRDYRTDVEIEKLCQDNLVVLDFHEAESYLCEPKFVFDFSQSLQIKPVTCTEIEDKILTFAAQQANRTAYARTMRRAFFRFQLDASADWVNRVDIPQILTQIEQSVSKEIQRLSTMNVETVQSLFLSEKKIIDDLIGRRDATSLLAIVPGKELLMDLVRLLGLRDLAGFLNAVSHKMTPAQYPHLAKLQKRILDAFAA